MKPSDVSQIGRATLYPRRASVGATVGAVWWLDWLNKNGVAVTVVVTGVYAVFTVLLWLATKRQATLTQQAFAATNRPY